MIRVTHVAGEVSAIYETETVDEMIVLLGRNDTISVSMSDTESEWIEYNGSGCPVPLDTIIEVKLRSGEHITRESRLFRWAHLTDDTDIVAYRVVKQ